MSIQVIYGVGGPSLMSTVGDGLLDGCFQGSSQFITTAIPPGGAGTFRNLRIRLQTAPGGGQTRTYVVTKSGAATGLTLTFATGEISKEITGVDVHYDDNNTFGFDYATSGGGSDSRIWYALDYEPDANNVQMYGFGGGSAALSQTFNAPLSGHVWTNVSFQGDQLIGLNGTIQSLAFKTQVTPSGANTMQIALAKNGTLQDGSGGSVDTRCIIANPATRAAASFSLPVVIGDRLRITYTLSVEIASNYDVGALTFLPDVPTEGGMVAMTGAAAPQTGTSFHHPRSMNNHVNAWDLTESDVEFIGGTTTQIFTGMICEISAAPTSGKSWTFTLRKNNADTPITVTISDSATTGSISGENVPITSSDRWCLSASASGTPSSTTANQKITLEPLAVETPLVASERNLLTGESHTVTGSDDLIAGVTGTLVGDRSVLFSLDGAANSVTGDGTFWVFGETNLDGTLTVNAEDLSLPVDLSAALDDLGT